MNLIVKSIFGSYLYGTNTKNSDRDYKGIYLPTKKECYLNDIQKSINFSTSSNKIKNNIEDIDEEIYSLQYFMKLAVNGEMIVIDLIHAPDEMLLKTSDIWKKIRAKRSEFYSKKLSGYLGYIRKQTQKYCFKGKRLIVMKEFLNLLDYYINLKSKNNKILKLKEIWNKLPLNDYSRFVYIFKEKRWPFYEICGKLLQPTISIEYAYNIIKKEYDSYGERARQAEKNVGIDWKAISHAFRSGYQLKEIYETGDLKFPLKKSEYIKNIKLGNYHYYNDNIGEKLDNLLLEIEILSSKSKYPEYINIENLNKFILECYEK